MSASNTNNSNDSNTNSSDKTNNFVILNQKSDTHIISNREIASVHICFQIPNTSRIKSEPNLNVRDLGDSGTKETKGSDIKKRSDFENRDGNGTSYSGCGKSETRIIYNNNDIHESQNRIENVRTNDEGRVDFEANRDSNADYTESSDENEEIIIKPVHTISLVSLNLNDDTENIVQDQENLALQNQGVPAAINPSGSCNPLIHLVSKRGPDLVEESSEDRISMISKARVVNDYPIPEVNSSLTMGGRRCRICMSCGTERLISPCHCKGSLGVIHVSCLERWLSTSGRASCELCGYSFPVVMTQRYSIYSALVIWLKFSRNRTTFMTDCLFFWTLTVLTASLVVCCIMGSKYFMEQGGTVGMPRALAEGMTDVLLAVVVCGYAITTYVLWKDHATLWRRWRMATMDVRLVLEDLQSDSDIEDNTNDKSDSERNKT